jgi:2-amino-4-hydroxy-6-hydroxymethyldihydropteridine diphosphokinase
MPMKPAIAAVALGANLPSRVGQPGQTLRAALRAIEALPSTRVLRASKLYGTHPVSEIVQPDFTNAAALVRTRMTPVDFLEGLLAIERSFGRDRASEQRWGPRTLDLDLLLYGDRRIKSAMLTLPHPHMHERRFVLEPLAEIARHLPVPGTGVSVGELLRRLDA